MAGLTIVDLKALIDGLKLIDIQAVNYLLHCELDWKELEMNSASSLSDILLYGLIEIILHK